MTRSEQERITDILDAIDKCTQFRSYLNDPEPVVMEMAFDADIRNISIIGEAVNHLPATVKDAHPKVDWPAIVGMRNNLVHYYFGVDTDLVQHVIDRELQPVGNILRQHIS